MTAKAIRKAFIDYFVKQKHLHLPSSSLIPEGDVSVLLTTAGMQQFKKFFAGTAQPPSKRICTVQKCFRTNDIDEVGDETHHTFFEMLGNFAFGDYFKEEAIKFVWEVCTQVYGLKKEDLFVTVFEGNPDVPRDEESIALWKKIAGDDIEIKEFGREDNFWGPTGEEGPCGPSSEIHIKLDSLMSSPRARGSAFELAGKIPASVGMTEGGRTVEIWNLVFTEYYQDKQGKLTPLDKKNIDTGMGLERITMVVQGKRNTYETDLFSPLIAAAKDLLQLDFGDEHDLRSARIIADHMRGSTFLMADGVEPSNVERGYVLRRLIRRAMVQLIVRNHDPAELAQFIDIVVKEFGDEYPELKEKQLHVHEVFEKEVGKYKQALRQGLRVFEKEVQKLDPGSILGGKIAFLLHDTYGMPLDLTIQLAREKQLDVDLEGFEQALKEQKDRSRAHRDESKETYDPALIAPVHTAAHLLNAALMKVLGNGVKQAGQKLTPSRVRHDITFDRKITVDELKKIEHLVNEKVKENLPVTMVESTYEQAKKEGAQALFYETYQAKQHVTRYKINSFSDELCGGPHVDWTGKVGHVTIEKEESAGAGKRRIYARVEA